MMTTTTPAAVINTNEVMNVIDVNVFIKSINESVESADEWAYEHFCPEDGYDMGDSFDYCGSWDAWDEFENEDGYTYYISAEGEASYNQWFSKGSHDSYGVPLEPDYSGGGINWVSIDYIEVARIKTGEHGDEEIIPLTDEVKKELISYIEERVFTGEY